jgi:hypothetical protein
MSDSRAAGMFAGSRRLLQTWFLMRME